MDKKRRKEKLSVSLKDIFKKILKEAKKPGQEQDENTYFEAGKAIGNKLDKTGRSIGSAFSKAGRRVGSAGSTAGKKFLGLFKRKQQ